MAEYIVDTNVPLIAQNNRHMTLDCSDACAKFMEELMTGKHILVLDDSYHILDEYKANMYASSQSDYGNVFLKWIYTNLWNPNKIKQVSITHVDGYDFSEVPKSVIDAGFDNSDRKFVAVAVANNFLASIVEAADSKWIGWNSVLNKERVVVRFLCKQELTEIYKRKTNK